MEALADGLGRAVPFIERVARGLRRLALLAGLAAVVLWLAIARSGIGEGDGRVLRLVLWAILLVAPAVVLFADHLALRSLAGLPDRVRALPCDARTHGEDLARLARETRRIRQRGWLRSGWSLFRFGRRAAASRELLQLAGPVAFLFFPGALAASALALAAAAVEVLLAVPVLVWLVLT